MKVKTSIQLWKKSKKVLKYKDCHLYVICKEMEKQNERMKKQNLKGRINAYACSEVEGCCPYADKCRKSETKVQRERERERGGA